MNNWTNEAIILSARKFGERDLIVTVFAEHEGVYSGVVRGGQGKKNSPIFQPGNLIQANWKARLAEHIGTMTGEIISANAALVLQDRFRLQAVLSACSIVSTTFADRDKDNDFYHKFKALIDVLKDDSSFLREYVLFEIALLQHAGFGLDLTVCAVTGKTENLAYVSPKTARAVSIYAARGYEPKLLKLPQFLIGQNDHSREDIMLGLVLTEHFLFRNLFFPHNRQLPAARSRLSDMLGRENRLQMVG